MKTQNQAYKLTAEDHAITATKEAAQPQPRCMEMEILRLSLVVEQVTAQRDELLAALTKAQSIVFQWERRVYHGKTKLADKITSLIAKCEAHE